MTAQPRKNPKVHLESVLDVIDDGSVKEEEFGVLEMTDDCSVDKGFKGVFGELMTVQ